MVMLNQYSIGRLQFYLSQVETPQCKLKEMDLTFRRYAKRWLKLPECSTEYIMYAGTEKGGLSLPRLSLSVPCRRINVKMDILNSLDKNICAFPVATGLPEEIGRDAEHFKIKILKNAERTKMEAARHYGGVNYPWQAKGTEPLASNALTVG